MEGEWKLVRVNNPGVRTGQQLFHLVSDPMETYDYAAEHPTVAARLATSLQAWHQTVDSGRPWMYWQSA